MNGNCMIVQSGGPTAVINNSIVGIVDEALKSQFSGQVYGAVGGLHGLLNGTFTKLHEMNSKDLYHLRRTPGAALGTRRYKLTPEDFGEIIRILKKNNIRYFFYIGGNGSMSVAKLVDEYARARKYELTVIGVPKSIDNDLNGTDHSPGFGSAAKFLATCVLDIEMDMESYPGSNRITILEAMGRHTGWLAAACSLADTEESPCQQTIYIPESPFEMGKCLEMVSKAYNEKRNSIIIVSEGIKDTNGNLVGGSNIKEDVLGRPKLGGVSSFLKEVIETESGIQTRCIEPSIWQRSSMMFASKTDVNEAYEAGKQAWILAQMEYNGVMVALEREKVKEDYHITYKSVELSEVAGKERFLPIDWYNSDKCTMLKEFKEYASPIIQGEMFVPTHDGLPRYQRII
ncbi:diphosphate--fructose-6-phosphate 1-phosphotransferase [Bacillus sp. SD075]|uniref:diphosphate--fructose-6-phosphate 1-phosphotransferase n=1 Tax=Bacillus sp. SD075 TaxID=2781732 RepID=UPI001A9736AE|nr:diphosphate--fructose-6-phosphate 1-phosphotransferase [Bacillus sp. SD075]MBO0997551.1 diphosphate--fructose-6-phosphate 1-phosphotransferase [Bacillus sp. SD075]